MAYFANHHSALRYPLETNDTVGLRNAQIGALHAIGAHFSLYDTEPAIVAMPTGSGKSKVLNLSAYLLRARRVLVLASSALVRGQLVDEFEAIQFFQEHHILDDVFPPPQIFEVDSIQATLPNYEQADVVVALPQTFLKTFGDEPIPPELFDLIIVDEAHHEPAPKWRETVECFPKAKKVYFTATPFRNDDKEIKGEFVFNYPLSRAVKDGIFGKIIYRPVQISINSPDVEIALQAAAVLAKDREDGFAHVLMVRTDGIDHANELLRLYELHTHLRLAVVHSSHGQSKKIISKLRKGELDGVICVNMMGEGFDFPQLKIAAVHRPHKSLAITLQFIGRFARTNDPKVGTATFLAIPDESLAIERSKLYSLGAVWQDLIIELQKVALKQEVDKKQFIKSFIDESPNQEAIEKFSLWNLRPFCHVKIFQADEFYIEMLPDWGSYQTFHHTISEEFSCVIFILREKQPKRWLMTADLADIKHELIVIHFNSDAGFLFINSTLKNEDFYDYIASSFTEIEVEESYQHKIPTTQIDRVLHGVADMNCFSVGLANRNANQGESYRTSSGSKTQNSVTATDARLYSAGHIMATGNWNHVPDTIGFSSASKVWSNRYQPLPEFVAWCQEIGRRLLNPAPVVTNTNLDQIARGERTEKVPVAVFFISWHSDTLNHLPLLQIGPDGEHIPLVDFDLAIERDKCHEQLVHLSLRHTDAALTWTFDYSFSKKGGEFKAAEGTILPEQLHIHSAINSEVDYHSLITYLNHYPVQLQLIDGSCLSGHLYHPPIAVNGLYYADECIQVEDWNNYEADICREFYEPPLENPAQWSIHQTIQRHLVDLRAEVIIYDHGTGEIADYITILDTEHAIHIVFYHAKGAGGIAPGERVGDLYEVCGQAIKTTYHIRSPEVFIKKLKERTANAPEKYIAGSWLQCKTILEQGKPLHYQVCMVQPGVSKSKISTKTAPLLAACGDFLIKCGHQVTWRLVASN